MTNQKFTADDDAFIIVNAGKLTSKQIAEQRGLNHNGVKTRARLLGVSFSANKPRWTDKQDALLKDMAGHHPVSQIAAACRKTAFSVRNRAHALGLDLAYERKPYIKLTTAHMKEARRLRDIGLSFNQIAQVMYISKSTARYLLEGNR